MPCDVDPLNVRRMPSLMYHKARPPLSVIDPYWMAAWHTNEF